MPAAPLLGRLGQEFKTSLGSTVRAHLREEGRERGRKKEGARLELRCFPLVDLSVFGCGLFVWVLSLFVWFRCFVGRGGLPVCCSPGWLAAHYIPVYKHDGGLNSPPTLASPAGTTGMTHPRHPASNFSRIVFSIKGSVAVPFLWLVLVALKILPAELVWTLLKKESANRYQNTRSTL